ncbi:MAG: amino acid permease, partial [Myxococcota bacterium]|nr:amino acid permease [Myxococcota bacterium]
MATDEQRRIGAPSAAMLVVGSTIGTGVFTTTGLLLADLGSPLQVMLVWAIGGALAMCGALAYGELTAALPENGGEYALLSRIYHPALGFVSGWISLIVGFSAPMAAAAIAFGAYVEPLVPGVDRAVWAVGLIVALSSMHAFRVRAGARLQDAITWVDLVLVAAIAGIGIALGRPGSAFVSDGASFGALAVRGDLAIALVWVSFSYSGWNAAAYVAGEVRDPG